MRAVVSVVLGLGIAVACGSSRERPPPLMLEPQPDASGGRGGTSGAAGSSGAALGADAHVDARTGDGEPDHVVALDAPTATDANPRDTAACTGDYTEQTMLSLGGCPARPPLINDPCCSTKPSGPVWRGDPQCGAEAEIYEQFAFAAQGNCWQLAAPVKRIRCCR